MCLKTIYYISCGEIISIHNLTIFQYVEGNDATNTTGYYTSQYIGNSLDPFTNDYPEYLDGLFNIDGSKDPIYGF